MQLMCRHTWVRIAFSFQDVAEAKRKAGLPKFRLPATASFPIFVVSLKNATKRRAQVQQQFKDRGIKYTWFDAIDGGQQMPVAEVQGAGCSQRDR